MSLLQEHGSNIQQQMPLQESCSPVNKETSEDMRKSATDSHNCSYARKLFHSGGEGVMRSSGYQMVSGKFMQELLFQQDIKLNTATNMRNHTSFEDMKTQLIRRLDAGLTR